MGAPEKTRTLAEALTEREHDLLEWLRENAPEIDDEQRHLDEGSIERAYWHYGYLMALRDIINFAGGWEVSAAHEDYDDYSDYVDCWQCGGQGGWTSCMEDTCCALGGEEGCTDPLCWRQCDICKGQGGWERIESPPPADKLPARPDKTQEDGK